MAGFLRGWLRGEPIERCCRLRQRLRRPVVSRHGCAPAMPSWLELQHFLATARASARCATTPTSSTCTARRPGWATGRSSLCSPSTTASSSRSSPRAARDGAIDAPRAIGSRASSSSSRRGGQRGASASTGFGVIVDDRYGEDVLPMLTGGAAGSRGRSSSRARVRSPSRAAPTSRWTCATGRPSMSPSAWSATIPTTTTRLQAAQLERLGALQAACVAHRPRAADRGDPAARDGAAATTSWRARSTRSTRPAFAPTGGSCRRPAATPTGTRIAESIARHDPHCRGVLLLGLEASEAELARSFATAAPHAVCRGFAVGRSIFAPAADGAGSPAR